MCGVGGKGVFSIALIHLRFTLLFHFNFEYIFTSLRKVEKDLKLVQDVAAYVPSKFTLFKVTIGKQLYCNVGFSDTMSKSHVMIICLLMELFQKISIPYFIIYAQFF